MHAGKANPGIDILNAKRILSLKSYVIACPSKMCPRGHTEPFTARHYHCRMWGDGYYCMNTVHRWYPVPPVRAIITNTIRLVQFSS